MCLFVPAEGGSASGGKTIRIQKRPRPLVSVGDGVGLAATFALAAAFVIAIAASTHFMTGATLLVKHDVDRNVLAKTLQSFQLFKQGIHLKSIAPHLSL